MHSATHHKAKQRGGERRKIETGQLCYLQLSQSKFLPLWSPQAASLPSVPYRGTHNVLGKPIQMPAGRDEWLIRVLTMKGAQQFSEGLSKKKQIACKIHCQITTCQPQAGRLSHHSFPFGFGLLCFFFSFPSDATIIFLIAISFLHPILTIWQLKYSAVTRMGWTRVNIWNTCLL